MVKVRSWFGVDSKPNDFFMLKNVKFNRVRLGAKPKRILQR